MRLIDIISKATNSFFAALKISFYDTRFEGLGTPFVDLKVSFFSPFIDSKTSRVVMVMLEDVYPEFEFDEDRYLFEFHPPSATSLTISYQKLATLARMTSKLFEKMVSGR